MIMGDLYELCHSKGSAVKLLKNRDTLNNYDNNPKNWSVWIYNAAIGSKDEDGLANSFFER